MKLIRKLFGLDFPDPEVGQVWRSQHSGRAFRVESVQRSDCGRMWHIDLQTDVPKRMSPGWRGGFNPLPMSYCMFPHQWRRMLRNEGRTLEQVTR